MNRKDFIKMYWKQYLLLEKEFIATDDYVTIEKINYDTYSNKYLSLLLAVCSEIDSLSAEVCKLGGDKISQGFRNKLNIITIHYPKILECGVDMKFPWGIENIKPFQFKDESLEWWKAYNDVKHQRTEKNAGNRYNYTKANLKNVLSAIAALYIIECVLYEGIEYDLGDDDDLDNYTMESKLFKSEFILY